MSGQNTIYEMVTERIVTLLEAGVSPSLAQRDVAAAQAQRAADFILGRKWDD